MPRCTALSGGAPRRAPTREALPSSPGEPWGSRGTREGGGSRRVSANLEHTSGSSASAWSTRSAQARPCSRSPPPPPASPPLWRTERTAASSSSRGEKAHGSSRATLPPEGQSPKGPPAPRPAAPRDAAGGASGRKGQSGWQWRAPSAQSQHTTSRRGVWGRGGTGRGGWGRGGTQARCGRDLQPGGGGDGGGGGGGGGGVGGGCGGEEGWARCARVRAISGSNLG